MTLYFRLLPIELNSFANLAFDLDVPSVGVDYLLGDGKPKAAASCFFGAGKIDPVKPLKNMRQMLGRDAYAVVFDRNLRDPV